MKTTYYVEIKYFFFFIYNNSSYSSIVEEFAPLSYEHHASSVELKRKTISAILGFPNLDISFETRDIYPLKNVERYVNSVNK